MTKTHDNNIPLDAISRAAALRQSPERLFGADAILRVLEVVFPDHNTRRTFVATAFRNATAPLEAKPREQVTVVEAAKWLSAAYAQAVRIDPSPIMRYAAFEAVQHSARALAFDVELEPGKSSFWTQALASAEAGKALDMQRLLTESMVPARARAFKDLPRNDAVEQFPELGAAYSMLDRMAKEVRGTEVSNKKVLDSARRRMYEGLRSGYVPRPQQEQKPQLVSPPVPPPSHSR